MADTTTWPCVHCPNATRWPRLATKSGWAKKQVDHSPSMPFHERPSDADGIAADVYVVANAEGNEIVLKLHRYVHTNAAHVGTEHECPMARLGRISFRTIKAKRDYLGKRKSASWMYMSRLAAQKEWAFMKVSFLLEHTDESRRSYGNPGPLRTRLSCS